MSRPDLWNSTVAQLRSGSTQEELSDMLGEAVNMARETGRQATVTLQIIVKPIGDGQYEIRDKVSHKLPELPRGMTLMYGTPEGNLMRDNPKQASLNLRSADEAPAPLKHVEGA